ncbi:MAG: DUF4169 family protein [Labrys sp. (in: a-proteobacteria)]
MTQHRSISDIANAPQLWFYRRHGYFDALFEQTPLADILNLGRIRKNRERDQKAAKAQENRVRFGRTKAEREREAANLEILSRSLDQRRLETKEESGH